MKRRKVLAGLGSLAAGGAAAMGTGAFSTVWTNRTITAQVVGDANAYLGLEDISPYARVNGNKLVLDFAGGTSGQNGDGLNEDANTRFQNVFRIVNQGTKEVSIQASDDPGTAATWDSSGLVLYWTDDAAGVGDLAGRDAMHDVDDITEAAGTATEDIPRLAPGDDIYVHPVFLLGPYNKSNTIANDVPDQIGFYGTIGDYGAPGWPDPDNSDLS